jgi:hypothetical protein
MKVGLFIASFDVINVIGNFFVYFFLTMYLYWLLGLDETRFRGQKNDFKVSANVNSAEVKLDLLRESHAPRTSLLFLQHRQ